MVRGEGSWLLYRTCTHAYTKTESVVEFLVAFLLCSPTAPTASIWALPTHVIAIIHRNEPCNINVGWYIIYWSMPLLSVSTAADCFFSEITACCLFSSCQESGLRKHSIHGRIRHHSRLTGTRKNMLLVGTTRYVYAAVWTVERCPNAYGGAIVSWAWISRKRRCKLS